jgi:hypothetical protein
VRLAAVLDDRQVVAGGDALDRGHVRRLPVHVHRDNRARARTDRAFHLSRIEGQAIGVDVRKHRPRARHHHGERGVRGRQRCRDHLVARADAERAQDERNRVGAGADADAVPRAHRGRKLRFEGLDLRAENEPPARDDAVDRATNGRRVLPRRQRQKRNAESARCRHTRSGAHMPGACTPGAST